MITACQYSIFLPCFGTKGIFSLFSKNAWQYQLKNNSA